MKENYDYFILATKYMIKHGGRNGGKLIQKDFAKAVACTPEHLSGILSPKQIRKASISLQEKIAGYFDMPLNNYIDFGRSLNKGPNSQQGMQAGTPAGTVSLPNEPFTYHNVSDGHLIELISQAGESAKRTQAELQKLRSIIELMGDAVAILSREQIVEFQNQAHREMFGGVYVGRLCPIIALAKEGEPRCPSCDTINTGITKKSIITLTDERTLSITASVLRDNSGYIIGSIVTIRNITERQRLMVDNVIMRERLVAILEKITEGVMLYDENRRIIFYNKKFLELTGATVQVMETTDSLAGHIRRRGIVTNLDEIQEKMKEAFVAKEKTSVECYSNNGTPTRIYTVEPITSTNDRFLGFMATITDK